jgi:hypothetical protein
MRGCVFRPRPLLRDSRDTRNWGCDSRGAPVAAESGISALAFEFGERLREHVAAVKNIVAKNQRNGVASDEGFGDQKSPRNAGRSRLFAIFNGNFSRRAVTQQLLKS